MYHQTTLDISPTLWKEIKYIYGKNKIQKNHFINKYERQVYSQHGEDGVLEYIFSQIGHGTKYFIEFGASDGVTMSNTLYLEQKYKWKGLLFDSHKHHNKLNRPIFIECITPSTINDIFQKYQVPQVFDLLSIDIDGNDFWVWKALTHFQPRIVIIETNASIPNQYPLSVPESVNHYHNGNYFGANLRAFYKLAVSKDYYFVTTVSMNAIFIHKDEFYKLDMKYITENEAIQKYFKPDDHWFYYKNHKGKIWINPFRVYKINNNVCDTLS